MDKNFKAIRDLGNRDQQHSSLDTDQFELSGRVTSLGTAVGGYHATNELRNAPHVHTA